MAKFDLSNDERMDIITALDLAADDKEFQAEQDDRYDSVLAAESRAAAARYSALAERLIKNP